MGVMSGTLIRSTNMDSCCRVEVHIGGGAAHTQLPVPSGTGVAGVKKIRNDTGWNYTKGTCVITDDIFLELNEKPALLASCKRMENLLPRNINFLGQQVPKSPHILLPNDLSIPLSSLLTRIFG